MSETISTLGTDVKRSSQSVKYALHMTTFGSRLFAARTMKGLSQRALGSKAGVSGTTISYWEDGTTDPQNIRNAALQAAAGALGVTVDYLLTGKDVREVADAPAGMRLADDNVRTVPLISHVQAGYGVGAIDAYPRGEGSTIVGVDAELASHLGRLAFALEIEGESMLPDFRPGDIVVIDPSVKPLPGDYVVAKIDGDDCATFKKYRPRGSDESGIAIFELVPMNEDYEIQRVSAENPGTIIGTMMEHRRKRRR